MTQILIATLAAGIGSVWLAALLGYYALARFNHQLLSLAAGALLATAFMHLLPEAFESATQAGIEPHTLFATLLAGLVFFFLLDKAQLYHHGHEHGNGNGDDAHEHSHGHSHGHSHDAHSGGSWAVLFGDSVHAFGDGIVIAAAFSANAQLGWAAALAVLTHEVPHHMGDLVVLGRNKQRALLKVTLAGTVTAIGGFMGYAALVNLGAYLPFFLIIASSSFIYVALADLIPQLQRRMSFSETWKQVVWLLLGMLMVIFVTSLSH